MTYLHICSERIINTPEGAKEIIEKVGVIKITDNGGWYVQLPIIPNAEFRVFPRKDEKLPVIE